MTLALPAHEELDLALRQAARRIAGNLLDFCALVEQAMADKLWERFGYVDEEDYWAERIGVSYRSLRRIMAIHDAIKRLPEPERSEARTAMLALGTHKAAALAKALPDHDWRELVTFAEQATTDAVQQRVSELTGALPRGRQDAPGAQFLAFILSRVPPKTRAHVEATFHATMRHADLTHPVAAFLVMVDRMAADLEDAGVEVK